MQWNEEKYRNTSYGSKLEKNSAVDVINKT